MLVDHCRHAHNFTLLQLLLLYYYKPCIATIDHDAALRTPRPIPLSFC